MTINYAEREFDWAALAEFVPHNDGHDIWRQVGNEDIAQQLHADDRARQELWAEKCSK